MSDQNSVSVMRPIDGLKPAFRALVHEFGAVIVLRMMADGYDNADALHKVLDGWRERRQLECATIAYLKTSPDSPAA